MLEKVRKTIEKYGLLNKGDTVLAAVSGGPDSTALLLSLLKLKKEYGLKLAVAHINYHLRKADSDRDQSFVEALAKKYGLPFYLKNIDGKKEFKTGSLQEKARELRYAFFLKLAGEIKANKLGVGHNKDDQVETVLMRFLRGSGAGGLSGMPVKRGLAEGCTLIRPLLEIKRKEIEGFLKKNKLKARKDKSNNEPVYLRNKLRLKLLPLLKKEYNSNIEDSLFRMSGIFSSENDFLNKEAVKHLKNSRGEYFVSKKEFDGLPAGLKLRVLRELIRKIKGDLTGVDSGHLAEALSHKKNISLPGGLSLLNVSGRLLAVKKTGNPKQIRLKVPGVTCFGNKKVAVTIKDVVKYFGRKNEAFLDAKKVELPLFIRTRRDGDRFMPFGMKKFKKLQDFMVDEKIPSYKRDLVPLLIDSRGDILWLAGCRADERYRVTQKTKKIICLSLQEA